MHTICVGFGHYGRRPRRASEDGGWWLCRVLGIHMECIAIEEASLNLVVLKEKTGLQSGLSDCLSVCLSVLVV